MANTNRLGELLVREKLISLSQLRTAQEEQQKAGGNLGYALAKLGLISDDEITNFLSQQYRVPTIDLTDYEIDAEILKLVSKEQCEKHRVIPVSRTGNSLIVAMADPTNLHAIDDLKFLTGLQHRAGHRERDGDPRRPSRSTTTSAPRTTRSWPASTRGRSTSRPTSEDVNLLELEKASEDAPVVRLVNMILLNAIKKGASDIHIEPYEKKLRVRLRIDGVLHEEMTPPLKLKNAIVSRLKIMSQLDIAERRLPQDGRIKLKLGKGTRDGLPRQRPARRLGREDRHAAPRQGQPAARHDQARLRRRTRSSDFMWAIDQPWGMVLVTGPTGSGKTTTLYSALSELNKPGAQHQHRRGSRSSTT